MIFHIVTIFPEIFSSYFNESVIKRAREKKLLDIRIHDLRAWTRDKRRTVDDAPYGGGAGMVMKAEPIIEAIARINGKKARKKKTKTVLFSAKGKKWNQERAKKYAKFDELVLICGRYEGVDERVNKFVDEEVSVGDYVLTGGEIPAMTIVDSVARLLPGVLGNAESAADESHSRVGLLEYPQYTRPEIIEIKGKKYRVPKVLLSGDHRKIANWRRAKMKKAD